MKNQISAMEILFIALGTSLAIAAFFGLRQALSPVLSDSEAWRFVPAIMLLKIALGGSLAIMQLPAPFGPIAGKSHRLRHPG